MSEVDNITPELIANLEAEIIAKLKTVYAGQVLHQLDLGYRLSVEEIIRDSCGNELSRIVREVDGSNEWGLHMIFDDIVHNPYNYQFLIRHRQSKCRVIKLDELDVLYAQVKDVLSLAEKYKEENIRRHSNEEITERLHN